MKRLLFTFLLSSVYFTLHAASDSVLINSLVKNIAEMQIKQDEPEFYKGMFYNFRECGGYPHNLQRDNTIFFTAITAFALKNMLPHLSMQNQTTASSIIQNAATAYPHFINRQGNPFYNFWPTYAPIMPHTYYFKYLKGVFGQGEDADDTVMILMTSENNDSANKVLKKRLMDVSNLTRHKIISTFKKYRSYAAYSTYLGFKMTPDFDFGVHCNVLYYMLAKGLPFTKQDSATLNLIEAMVKNRDYITSPVYISPYYVKTSVLLYHLTRLMSTFNLPQLDKYKPQLVADIKKQLIKSTNVMDEIILRTSLLRLNEEAPPLNISSIEEFDNSNQKNFIFFQARPAFLYPTPFKQIFLHFSYINYYFYCPAYNKTLWLEYLVEKKRRK